MQKVQYAILRKCTGAVVGARMESVNTIAVVESMETHLDAIQVRFMARVIEDPEGVGELIYMAGDGAPGILETDMMAKVVSGLQGAKVEWAIVGG